MSREDADDTIAAEGLDTRAMRGALEARLFGDAADPTTVGRFEILHSVGRGGMGVVYAAHDPQLDRRVALKLVHTDRTGRDSAPSGDLLAEARALARLTHRNVVTIYETGVHDGAVFLAMEFLDGGTLASWGQEHPVQTKADAAATLALYLEAGAGLAAAHEAELVHRDFKPANVLLGEDGRLVVADFGLARARSVPVDELATYDGPTDERMTTATIAGTPAYMAPEQFDGVVDARSDQFSFCVALWEALYGTRPFEGTTPAALRARLLRGEPPPSVGNGPTPGHVERALRRGLSLEPTERWPSMRALLAAMTHDPAVRIRRGGLVVAVVAAVGLAAWQPWAVDAEPCDGGDDALDAAWGPQRRAAVTEALTRTGSELGQQTLDRVASALDAYAGQWHALRRDRCEASLVRREQSAEAYDLTMRCLGTRRDELETLTGILSEGDPAAIERAVAATAALSAIEPCGDLESLRGELPADPVRAAELEAIDRRRIQVRALLDTGQQKAATEAIPAVVEAARAAGDARSLARALALQAMTHRGADRHAEARAALEEALRVAAAAGDDAIAAQLWPRLIVVVGQKLRDPEAALAWKLPAEAVVLRAGARPEDRAALHHALGNVHRSAHAFDDAEREHVAGLALRREFMADDKLEIADSLNRLAGVYFDRRDLPAAESMIREVLATFVEALGADHPRVATITYNLGGVLASQGRYEEAIEVYQEALRLYRAALGPRSRKVANTLNNLAAVLGRADRYDESIASSNQALDILNELLGRDSPALAPMYNNLGAAYDAAGRTEESLRAHEHAIALLRDEGPSPALALNHSNLGMMQAAIGQRDSAVASYERSITAYESSIGADHPDLWRPLAMLARLYRKEGDIDRALPLAERSVAVLEGHEFPAIEVADARFELAQIRRAAGLDDARTQELARSAQQLWLTADGFKEAAEVGRWLAAPEAPKPAR